jgi:hypothetical protein
MERFNLKKLNEAAVKGKHHVKISNRLAALENSDAEVDINRAWKAIRKNIKISVKKVISYYELKKSISHGSTKNAQNYYINGNKTNCSGYVIQAK